MARFLPDGVWTGEHPQLHAEHVDQQSNPDAGLVVHEDVHDDQVRHVQPARQQN